MTSIGSKHVEASNDEFAVSLTLKGHIVQPQCWDMELISIVQDRDCSTEKEP